MTSLAASHAVLLSESSFSSGNSLTFSERFAASPDMPICLEEALNADPVYTGLVLSPCDDHVQAALPTGSLEKPLVPKDTKGVATSGEE